VDIRKALAEGRKPVPGPPVTENDVPDGEDTTWGTEVFFPFSPLTFPNQNFLLC